MTDEPEVLFDQKGGLGLITLNRPKALNALTRDMCLKMEDQLHRWADETGVHAVAVVGAGDRGFCAGGDIRALYDSGKAGTSYVYDFYADEYRLNTYIKRYPKPYIAFIDGITMGGGVGVSVHGSHRVAGDKTVFAMPETGIGLFPDVGGSYFLPRLDGEMGMFLGLTGSRLKTADTVYAGIGTHYVPSDRQSDVIEDLGQNEDVDRVIGSYAETSVNPPIAEHRDAIDRHFSGGSVEEIVASLESGEEWAEEMAKTIATKSPTSLKITHRQIREGAGLDFEDCMRMEYRMTCRVMDAVDFYEGTRAVIIDKDNKPAWNPSSLEEVNEDDVAAYFEPLGDRELKL